MSTATTTTSYKVYGLPLDAKSYESNDDGTLTIIGVASTTNKDYANEIVSQEVLESLAQQAPGLNLFRDHNRHYEGGIGAIVDAWVQENMLWIKAVILKDFASGIKERLDIGMNFGFSISGFPRKQRTPDGILITDYDLKEITLTYIPMNWDTYGTVEYKSLNLVASNCLTGACYHAIHDGENMEEKENKIEEVPEDPVKDEKAIAGFSDEQVAQITDLVKNMMNEFGAEIEPRILENIEPKIESVAEAAGTKAAEKVADKILAEIKATNEVQEEDEGTVEEKDLTEKEEEEEVVETESTTEETNEEEVKSEAGIKEPETDSMETTEETEEEIVEEDEKETEDEVIDEKSLNQKIHDEIVKQLNEKSIPSKFKKFQESQKKKKESTIKPKRDSFGRNLKYI